MMKFKFAVTFLNVDTGDNNTLFLTIEAFSIQSAWSKVIARSARLSGDYEELKNISLDGIFNMDI